MSLEKTCVRRKAMSSWSNLPNDLSALVAQRLTTFSDTIRFGTVCKGWRRLAAAKTDLTAPRLPVLLIPEFWDPTTYSLCDPFSMHQYFQELHLPPPEKKVIIHPTCRVGVSSDGWLLLETDGSLDLGNPLLERRVQMSSLPLLPRRVRKAAYNGRKEEDFTVMAICGRELIFARAGDKSWTEPEPFGHIENNCFFNFRDIVYHKVQKQFYAVANDGKLVAGVSKTGDSNLHVSVVVPQPLSLDCEGYLCREILLVESSKLKLLLVVTYRRETTHDNRRYWFRVFKLKEDKCRHSSSWLEIESLGEDALFLSNKVSFVTPAAAAAASPGCIYFLCAYNYKDSVCVYSMQERLIVGHHTLRWLPDGAHWIWDRQI